MSTTSLDGGKIGWINSKSLSKKILTILDKMKIGDISEPIVQTNTATIIKLLDKKTINLVENENIFIPKGALHRIANKGSKDLIIIEMWYGEILDENDIKRYDKNYKII